MRILKLNVFIILLLMLVLPIRGETTWEFKNGNFLFLVQESFQNQDREAFFSSPRLLDLCPQKLHLLLTTSVE